MKSQSNYPDANGGDRELSSAQVGVTGGLDLTQSIRNILNSGNSDLPVGYRFGLTAIAVANLLGGCGALPSTKPLVEQHTVSLSPVVVAASYKANAEENLPERSPSHENADTSSNQTLRTPVKAQGQTALLSSADGEATVTTSESAVNNHQEQATLSDLFAMNGGMNVVDTEVVGLRVKGRRAWQQLRIDDYDVLLRTDGERLLHLL